jgi:glucosyl-dolichyl phosphate glucuronosyltransferase
MSSRMQISLVVTTYNREKLLLNCLEAVASQSLERAAFEVLIVDNNSRDNTKQVVLDFIEAHPELNMQYILETVQGTSFARNRGVESARGEIISFTEDDAAPLPNWLETIANSFSDQSVGCVGGPIILDYQGQEKPPYLKGDLQGLLGQFKLPYTEPTFVSIWKEFPWGGNMSFRKAVFSEVGLFRTDLGPSAKRRLTAEETEYIARVHKSGWKVLYNPNAEIRHFVPPERLRKSHLYHVSRGLAASHVVLTGCPKPLKVLRWFASDLWYSVRMFIQLVWAIVRRKELWFDDYMRFWAVAMRIPIRLNYLLDSNYFEK